MTPSSAVCSAAPIDRGLGDQAVLDRGGDVPHVRTRHGERASADELVDPILASSTRYCPAAQCSRRASPGSVPCPYWSSRRSSATRSVPSNPESESLRKAPRSRRMVESSGASSQGVVGMLAPQFEPGISPVPGPKRSGLGHHIACAIGVEDHPCPLAVDAVGYPVALLPWVLGVLGERIEDGGQKVRRRSSASSKACSLVEVRMCRPPPHVASSRSEKLPATKVSAKLRQGVALRWGCAGSCWRPPAGSPSLRSTCGWLYVHREQDRPRLRGRSPTGHRRG